MRSHRRGRGWLPLVVLAWAVTATAAPSGTQSAARYLEQAASDFAAHRYAEATLALRAAYEADPKPSLLYSIGQAQRLGGDCSHAIESYRAFLATSPPARQALPALQHIERCRAELEHQPPPPPIEANMPAQQLAPMPVPHESAVSVVPAATPVIARPAPTSWRRDKLGWGLGGAGLALLVTGATLTGVGEGRIAAAADARTYDEYTAVARDASTGVPLRLAGIVALSTGGALILGSIVRFAIRAKKLGNDR